MLKRIRLSGAIALSLALATGSQMYAQSKTDRSQKKSEDQFLPHVLAASATEAEIGWLAAERAQNQRVKDFGQMVSKVHSNTVESLGGLYYVGAPATTNVRQQTSNTTRQKPADSEIDYWVYLDKDHQQMIDRLKGLSGATFDREVMNTMVRMHQDSAQFLNTHLSAFRGADSKQSSARTSGQTGTSDIRADFAGLCERLLPVVNEHLQQAQNIERELAGK